MTPSTKKTVEVDKKSLAYQSGKDKEMVKGMFKFYEVPGGSMAFMYRKYKGEKPERYSMVDGDTYTIPLGVAKHLNNDCWYPVHTYALMRMVNHLKKYHRSKTLWIPKLRIHGH